MLSDASQLLIPNCSLPRQTVQADLDDRRVSFFGVMNVNDCFVANAPALPYFGVDAAAMFGSTEVLSACTFC